MAYARKGTKAARSGYSRSGGGSGYRKRASTFRREYNTRGASASSLAAVERRLKALEAQKKPKQAAPVSASFENFGELGCFPVYNKGQLAERSYFRVPVTAIIPTQRPMSGNGATMPEHERFRVSTEYTIKGVEVDLQLEMAEELELRILVFPASSTLGWKPILLKGLLPEQWLLVANTKEELGLPHIDGPFKAVGYVVPKGDEVMSVAVGEGKDDSLFRVKLAQGAAAPYSGVEVTLDGVKIGGARPKKKGKSLLRAAHLYLKPDQPGVPGGLRGGVQDGKFQAGHGGFRNARMYWELGVKVKALPGSAEPVFANPIEALVIVRARGATPGFPPGDKDLMVGKVVSAHVKVYYS